MDKIKKSAEAYKKRDRHKVKLIMGQDNFSMPAHIEINFCNHSH